MRRLPAWVIGAIVAAAIPVAGCGGSSGQRDVDVPRIRAYYRLTLPAPDYRTDTLGYLPVAVNRAASATSDGSGWLTLAYPGAGAEVYLTLTPLDGDDGGDSRILNRVERLSMNTRGASTQMSEFVNDRGLECLLMVTPQKSPTPVQFIAVQPGEWMLSGSAMVGHLAEAPSDSLAPVVKMLERDLRYMLEQL